MYNYMMRCSTKIVLYLCMYLLPLGWVSGEGHSWFPGESDDGLGFGWSRAEWHPDGSFRWITRLEADLWHSVGGGPGEQIFRMEAAIPHLFWRRQRVALIINNRLIHEWATPDDHHFHVYECVVSENVWEEGPNRITLRMAYKTRIGSDSRRLSLAVRSIQLIPSSP